MNPARACICFADQVIHGCPLHWPSTAATAESTHRMLTRILETQEKILAAIDDLQTADASLQQTVSKVLADFAAALTAAQGDPAKVEQVVTDMNAMAAQLTAADPATPAPAPVTPPADGGTSTTPAA